MISNLIKNKNITLVNNGVQKRSFTYIDDGIEALLTIINNRNKLNKSLNINLIIIIFNKN